MYAPALVVTTNASHGTDLDTEFLLLIDQFDSWSIGDAALAYPTGSVTYQPNPGTNVPTDV
jgi:hypothetical protein